MECSLVLINSSKRVKERQSVRQLFALIRSMFNNPRDFKHHVWGTYWALVAYCGGARDQAHLCVQCLAISMLSIDIKLWSHFYMNIFIFTCSHFFMDLQPESACGKIQCSYAPTCVIRQQSDPRRSTSTWAKRMMLTATHGKWTQHIQATSRGKRHVTIA